jgi:hypothetical protein
VTGKDTKIGPLRLTFSYNKAMNEDAAHLQDFQMLFNVKRPPEEKINTLNPKLNESATDFMNCLGF